MAEQNQFYIDNQEIFDNLPKPPDPPPADEPEGTPNSGTGTGVATDPIVTDPIETDQPFVAEADNRVEETYKLSYNTDELKFDDSEHSVIDMREDNNIITIDLRSVVYKPEPFSEVFDIRIKSY